MRGKFAGIALSGLAITALPSHAQSLAGISLGDSEGKASAALPGAKQSQISDDPTNRVYFSDRVSFAACKGVVYSIGYETGDKLADYIRLVDQEEMVRGAPLEERYVSDIDQQTFAWLTSSWPEGRATYTVEIFDNGNGLTVKLGLLDLNYC